MLKSPLNFSLGFFIFFFTFLAFFIPFCWQTWKPIRAYLFFEKTTGTVQSAEYVDSSSPYDPSRPIQNVGTYTHQVIFQTPSGSTHRVFTTVKSNPPSLKIGETVPVYYDVDDPSRALIGTFSELWLGSLTTGFFSFLFFILWFGTLIEGKMSPMTLNGLQGLTK